MDIRTVGVIGAGTMGNGIAHVFAKNKYNVVLVDLEQSSLDRGPANYQQEPGTRGCEGQVDLRTTRPGAEAHHGHIRSQAVGRL